jgi:hypothetical protein
MYQTVMKDRKSWDFLPKAFDKLRSLYFVLQVQNMVPIFMENWRGQIWMVGQ